ncbi:GbsR/MarR family transcriptional regulator [Sessilibacter corallicola]|uniref:HTH-type transcriptional regulator n=1 Tax=Sessilibacter corallicola TaxID=2904075 RepID=A0ABQ0A6E5_9GAMM
MKLTEQTRAFIMHFGEMGSRWGFNRTVGQMMALLVIHEEALNADQIAEVLEISRGNVSMGLKELQSWRLVKLQHKPGDRKDYFTAIGSVWLMARTVMEERQKREIDPTLSLLRSNLLDQTDNNIDEYAYHRMEEIHNLLEFVVQWTDQLSSLSPAQLESLMKLGSGVSKLLELKGKVLGTSDK